MSLFEPVQGFVVVAQGVVGLGQTRQGTALSIGVARAGIALDGGLPMLHRLSEIALSKGIKAPLQPVGRCVRRAPCRWA